MACTWGAKVNGILTVAAIGIAVLIDLWDILDVKKNTMVSLTSHLSPLISLNTGTILETLLC